MKWFGAAIWLGGCVVGALMLYGRQRAKVQYYTGLIALCHQLHTAIGFTQQPLAQILIAYQETVSGVGPARWRQTLDGYLRLLTAKADITRVRCAALTLDADVAEFFYQLGRTGSEEEKNKITTALAIFSAKEAQAKHDLQHKTSIIAKLLIIMGIAGVILWM